MAVTTQLCHTEYLVAGLQPRRRFQAARPCHLAAGEGPERWYLSPFTLVLPSPSLGIFAHNKFSDGEYWTNAMGRNEIPPAPRKQETDRHLPVGHGVIIPSRLVQPLWASHAVCHTSAERPPPGRPRRLPIDVIQRVAFSGGARGEVGSPS